MKIKWYDIWYFEAIQTWYQFTVHNPRVTHTVGKWDILHFFTILAHFGLEFYISVLKNEQNVSQCFILENIGSFLSSFWYEILNFSLEK